MQLVITDILLLLSLQTRNSNIERFPYRRAIGERAQRSRFPVQSQSQVQTYRTDRRAATIESDRHEGIRSQSDANPNATTFAARCVRETAPILMRTFFR